MRVNDVYAGTKWTSSFKIKGRVRNEQISIPKNIPNVGIKWNEAVKLVRKGVPVEAFILEDGDKAIDSYFNADHKVETTRNGYKKSKLGVRTGSKIKIAEAVKSTADVQLKIWEAFGISKGKKVFALDVEGLLGYNKIAEVATLFGLETPETIDLEFAQKVYDTIH